MISTRIYLELSQKLTKAFLNNQGNTSRTQVSISAAVTRHGCLLQSAAAASTRSGAGGTPSAESWDEENGLS